MQWKPVHLTASGPPTVLELDGVGVVRLMDRVDGTWFAVLNYHLTDDRRKVRDCGSYESGRRGAEMWARRHLVRLEREASANRAKWARLPVTERGRERLPPTLEELEQDCALQAVGALGTRRRARRRR